jgi:carbon storage regulator
MLVLTRKLGETVLLGDDVEVTVVAVGPDGVRLGFVAPKDVRVMREELEPAVEPVGSSPGERVRSAPSSLRA